MVVQEVVFNHMRIILLGPPGAGKGTQAVDLSNKLNLVHISTGDIFREAIKNKTSLGEKAQGYMNRGELVPDQIVAEIVADRIQKNDCSTGFILDGFPRTDVQASLFDQILWDQKMSIDVVLNITCDEQLIISRLTGRRVCKDCGATYHVTNIPPIKEGICDHCQGVLFQREDDKKDTIINRLKVYNEQTASLIDFYKQKNILVSIDGSLPKEETFENMMDAVNSLN